MFYNVNDLNNIYIFNIKSESKKLRIYYHKKLKMFTIKNLHLIKFIFYFYRSKNK
jgi:hypothetical protein